MRLIIADDSPDVRLLLSIALPVYGPFEILARARNGMEAFQATLDLQPDLLVLDYDMPQLNGLQTIMMLRQAGVGLPIVLYTANDSADLASYALDVGANAVLAKTSDLAALAAQLTLIGVHQGTLR